MPRSTDQNCVLPPVPVKVFMLNVLEPDVVPGTRYTLSTWSFKFHVNAVPAANTSAAPVGLTQEQALLPNTLPLPLLVPAASDAYAVASSQAMPRMFCHVVCPVT